VEPGRWDRTSDQDVGLRQDFARRLAPRVFDPSAFVRFVLLGVRVLALPHISRQVSEDCGEVMMASAAGGGRLPQLAAADDATESFTFGFKRGGGAAPKRGAVIFDQATT